MIPQAPIESAYLRAAYGELVGDRDHIVWFGAGAFAQRLAEALSDQQLGAVRAVVDDKAHEHERTIAGVPVRRPMEIVPPSAVLLATDTFGDVFRERVRSLWGDPSVVIDLLEAPLDSWVHPNDGDCGFAGAHTVRWRESLGLAQLELEKAHGNADRQARWLLAHAYMGGSSQRIQFKADEHRRFQEESPSFEPGRVITIAGDTQLASDPFWEPILRHRYSAISPGGRSAVVIWARSEAFRFAPLRIGNALWIPRSLGGDNRYTVRFEGKTGIEDMEIEVTRERTYADVEGAAELERYERIAEAFPVGARVLDCASGTGFGAMYLHDRGFEVTGVEVDRGSVAFASARYPEIDFVCADAELLPFNGDAFDAVVCIETIEHVADPVAALAEMARVCKPDGVLWLTTPGEGANDSPYHISEFSMSELREVLDRALGHGRWIGEPVTREGGWHEFKVRSLACARM